ncbi:MAG TPA: hypothetical protein VN792_02605, partial [Candidatus Acidoferrales bacterium]|nr:hypothetical protein [Candidatus Acidoferrales bacterium]
MKTRLIPFAIPLAFVALLWIASAGAASDKNAELASQVAALKTQIAQIADQIQNSQDVFAINNLQDAYGYYV